MSEDVEGLKKKLATEQAAREELEKWKRDKLILLQQTTQDAINKTKNKLQEEINMLQVEKMELQEKLNHKDQELKKFSAPLATVDEQVAKLQQELESAKEQYKKMDNDRKAIRDQLEWYRKQTKGSTDGTKKLEEEKAKLVQELQQIKAEVSQSLSQGPSKVASNVIQLEEDLKKLNAKLKSVEAAKCELEQTNKNLHDELSKTKTHAALSPRSESTKSKLQEMLTLLDDNRRLELAVKEKDILIVKYEKEVELLKQNRQSEKHQLEQDVQRLKENSFKEIAYQEQTLNTVQKEVDHWKQQFESHQHQWSVEAHKHRSQVSEYASIIKDLNLQLETKVEELNQHIQTLQSELDTTKQLLQYENMTRESAQSESERVKNDLQKTISEKDAEIQSLSQSMDSVKNRVQDYKDKFTALEQEFQTKSELVQRLNQLVREKDDLVAALESDVQTLHQNTAKNEELIETYRKGIQERDNNMVRLKDLLQEKENAMKSVQLTVAESLQQQLQEVRSQAAVKEGVIQQLRTLLNEHEGIFLIETTKLTEEVEQLKDIIQQHVVTHKDLQREMEAIKEVAEGHLKALGESLDHNKDLQQTVTAKDTSIATLEEELQLKEAQIVQLLQQSIAMCERLQDKEQKISHLEALEQAHQINTKNLSQMQQLRLELKQANDQLSSENLEQKALIENLQLKVQEEQQQQSELKKTVGVTSQEIVSLLEQESKLKGDIIRLQDSLQEITQQLENLKQSMVSKNDQLNELTNTMTFLKQSSETQASQQELEIIAAKKENTQLKQRIQTQDSMIANFQAEHYTIQQQDSLLAQLVSSENRVSHLEQLLKMKEEQCSLHQKLVEGETSSSSIQEVLIRSHLKKDEELRRFMESELTKIHDHLWEEEDRLKSRLLATPSPTNISDYNEDLLWELQNEVSQVSELLKEEQLDTSQEYINTSITSPGSPFIGSHGLNTKTSRGREISDHLQNLLQLVERLQQSTPNRARELKTAITKSRQLINESIKKEPSAPSIQNGLAEINHQIQQNMNMVYRQRKQLNATTPVKEKTFIQSDVAAELDKNRIEAALKRLEAQLQDSQRVLLMHQQTEKKLEARIRKLKEHNESLNVSQLQLSQKATEVGQLRRKLVESQRAQVELHAHNNMLELQLKKLKEKLAEEEEGREEEKEQHLKSKFRINQQLSEVQKQLQEEIERRKSLETICKEYKSELLHSKWAKERLQRVMYEESASKLKGQIDSFQQRVSFG